ncbi:hypothetical protein MRB53_041289 [Persea americana]|nr:hypothetical protein MRB53_041289 [Persea americana]
MRTLAEHAQQDYSLDVQLEQSYRDSTTAIEKPMMPPWTCSIHLAVLSAGWSCGRTIRRKCSVADAGSGNDARQGPQSAASP